MKGPDFSVIDFIIDSHVTIIMLQRGIRLFSILKRKGAFFKMAKAPEEEPEKPKAEPSRAAINFDKSYLKTLNDIGLKPKKEQKPAQ